MGKFTDAVKKGFSEAWHKRYSIAGKAVTCSHCGNDTFEKADAQLNTPGMTFLGLDWANRTATALICDSCSHVELFLDEPDEAE